MSRHLVWLVLAISVLFNLAFAAAWLSARTAPAPVPAEAGAGDDDGDADEAATTSNDGSTDVRDDARGETQPDASTALPRAGDRDDPSGAAGLPGRGGPGRLGPPPLDRRGPDPMLRQVARALDLDAEQEAYLGGLQSGMKSDEMLFDVAIAAVRERLVEAYEVDGIADAGSVRELHEREAELLRQRRLARAERLEAFMAVLRPEQIARFQAMIESRTHRERAGAGERLAELDVDGDGQLDEQEIAALRRRIDETIAARTERAIERRRELRERFDADGDGTLDRAEREEARRWQMRQRFDADGDGELDADEQAALERAREAWRQRWRDGEGRDRRWRRDRGDRDRGRRGDRDRGTRGGMDGDPAP